MTLNGRNAPLVKIKSSYGAQHKNFNEDRLVLSAAKYRSQSLVSKNIKYMRKYLWTFLGSAVKGHFGREGRNFLNFLLPYL